MTVAEMERRFYELKGKIDVGAIGEDEFKSEIEKLRFQDSQNRWWMIGAQSGRWYMYDGERWIPGKPPEIAAPEPTQPIPPPGLSSTPPPTPVPTRTPYPQPVPSAPYPAMTERGGPRPVVPRTRAAPLPGTRSELTANVPLQSWRPRLPLIIGCAALAALGMCIALVLVVENIVPGKPLSSTFSGVTGASSTKIPAAPTAVATRISAQLPAAPSDTTASFIAMGDDLLLKSLYDAAATQYQNASQLAPASAAPLTRLSYALSIRGQLQDALARAQQATQRAPNDAEAHAQLARVQTWLGQADLAMASGQKAVQLDGKNATAHAVLAGAYLSALKTSEAHKEAQAAVQLAPQSAEAHRALAWTNLILGQRPFAMSAWSQTIAFEPNLAWRHFEYAEVLRVYLRDPALAASEYRRAIELYGGYVPAYGRLGMALVDQNQTGAAITQLQRAVTLEPENAANFAYLGLAYGISEQCGQAIPYFEQALRLDPNNPVATKGLSDCKTGNPVTAPVPVAPPVPLLPPSVSPNR